MVKGETITKITETGRSTMNGSLREVRSTDRWALSIRGIDLSEMNKGRNDLTGSRNHSSGSWSSSTCSPSSGGWEASEEVL